MTASAIGRAVAFGTFTATGATTVNVPVPAFSGNCVVTFALKTVGGTILGQPYMFTATPGTGFGVRAGASDTSIYNYTVFQIEKA